MFWLNSVAVGALGQSVYPDGRESDPACVRIYDRFAGRPKEVRFGFQFNDDGELYFTTSDGEWVKKVVQPGMAVTADLVSMDRYDCNLVVLFQGKVAYYSNFLDIPQGILGLLPMGLFSDSLIQAEDTTGGILREYPITYERQARLVIPFQKGRADIDGHLVARAFDSLGLRQAQITTLDIRAYASVEGAAAVNTRLMERRVRAVVAAFHLLQPHIPSYHYQSGEDWLEFNQGLTRTGWARYAGFSKGDIKVRLLDRAVAGSLEELLASERKAVVTIYYLRKTGLQGLDGDSLTAVFRRAVAGKKVGEARAVLKEVYERIRDNSLPEDYLNRLEVPESVDFWELQSDKATYSYWLRFFDERQALAAFEKIHATKPGAGPVNYNIAALKLVLWHGATDTTRDTAGLMTSIGRLVAQGIDPTLVRRIGVNYYILLSQDEMAKLEYNRKDSAVGMVRKFYDGVPLTDADRYALAKFLSFYSQQDWAMELIAPRIDQLDVSEDLLFYYVNLSFFRPGDYGSDALQKAMLNAANLDRRRFCQLFHSLHHGGAGMQLLEVPIFRQFFCTNCKGE